MTIKLKKNFGLNKITMFEYFLNDYKKIIDNINETPLKQWRDFLIDDIQKKLKKSENKNTERWMEGFNSLPKINPSEFIVNNGVVSFGENGNQDKIKTNLMKIMPWRKGPYNINGVEIDTEWRSDIKWERLKNKISSLEGRAVLDIGTGNGYHLWRMLDEGAEFVVGVEPFMISIIQFYAIKHFSKDVPMVNLPFTLEELPSKLESFDTVFSMGVLYHSKSPIDHILKLKDTLKVGGELVLETIIIDDDYAPVLVPDNRYTKMRNVWFIPSPKELTKWLKKCGFTDIKCIDISRTTTEEQRKTEWMEFESLSDFLDKDNPELTIEGYPAPKRGIFVAKKR